MTTFRMPWERLYQYRELIYFLVRSDIVTRYKQTILGPAWVFLEPVIGMIVFTVVFGRIRETEVESITVAYPVFLYAGLLPWTYFRSALTKGANSLVSSMDIVQRVYFPREILVGIPVVTGLFDFGISFLIFVVLMVVFQVPIRLSMLMVFPLLLGLSLLILGLSFILSIINARYRDIRQLVPYALQVLLFVSPVIYPPSFLSESHQWLLSLNPMTGYLEAFRSALLGTHWAWGHLGISILITIVLFFGGWVYFRRQQAFVADVL